MTTPIAPKTKAKIEAERVFGFLHTNPRSAKPRHEDHLRILLTRQVPTDSAVSRRRHRSIEVSWRGALCVYS